MRVPRGAYLLAVVLVALGAALPLTAGPLEDAQAAYAKGDYATALGLWRDLAEHGDASAQANLGYLYETGRGVPKDDREAVQWYRKSADQGNALGQAYLGIALANGRGGLPQDERQALELFRKSVDQSNGRAQAALGYMYATGRGGLPQDDRQAVELLRKSADQGDALGQGNLGYMYATGRGGLPQDDRQAVEWYRKSADQGNGRGQVNLGYMYATGRGGLPQDDRQAVELFRKSADQGNASGQYNLGTMYLSGRGGLPQDDTQAVELFRKSAEQGDALGQVNLGFMYEQGRGGVTKDDAEAARWYRKAADQGDADAQTKLGIMYRDGQGVPQDQSEAALWFHKAAAQGNAKAKAVEMIAALSPTITSLVKKYEAAQPVQAAVDAERRVLAHEVVATQVAPEQLSGMRERAEASMATGNSKGLPPKVVEAMIAVALASFQRDAIWALWESNIAAALDATTLQAGLQWEHSDVGRRITDMETQTTAPEGRLALKQFAENFKRKGTAGNEQRARGCAQVDILEGRTEAILPFIEAMVAGGAMAAMTEQGKTFDSASVFQMVATLRPQLRDAARQGLLVGCLYAFRELDDTKFEEWLVFLRSDAGGRYARGVWTALRDALLARSAIFASTLVDVMRQIRDRPQA